MITDVNTKCKIYEAGTEVYYTGDNANRSGSGVITEVIEPSYYSGGWKYKIEMNDGRIFNMVYALSFGTRPGDRFMTKEERTAQMVLSAKQMIKYNKTETLKQSLQDESCSIYWEIIKEELEKRGELI